MNFYQAVFPENFLENIYKEGGFGGKLPFNMCTLSGQRYDQKSYYRYLKSRPYKPQNSGVAYNSKTF